MHNHNTTKLSLWHLIFIFESYSQLYSLDITMHNHNTTILQLTSHDITTLHNMSLNWGLIWTVKITTWSGLAIWWVKITRVGASIIITPIT